MSVAFDAQLTVGTATGIGVYQRDLQRALVIAGVDLKVLRAEYLDPWRFDRRVVWEQVLLPIAAARSGARLLHATAGTMPLVRTLPTVVTVHDLAWHRAQAHTRAYARVYFGTLQARAYEHAAAVMCDSRFSANEFRALIDADAAIDVVYPGVDGRFAHIVRARDDVRPFALVVGTVEARKNLKVLIDALPAIPRLRIVAVGPPTAYADECRARAAELGVAGRVELRGYVGREELDGLYAQASCALVPSRYEGFGYALAEALCAGLPVVAARTSSLIEVAGDGVPLLDPDDASAWSAMVNAMLSDPEGTEAAARERRAGAIARFAWATAAARVKGVYERVLG